MKPFWVNVYWIAGTWVTGWRYQTREETVRAAGVSPSEKLLKYRVKVTPKGVI